MEREKSLPQNGNGNGNANGNGNGNNGFHKNGISLISRIFNIAPPQWPRVTECWLITFFFKIGTAIGWTTVTAAFVSHFGIPFLPTLFVLNAVLIMVSTFFFERLIMKMKREVLMILMLLLGAVCLLFASMLYDRSPFIFFALVIFAESVFFAQFNVFIPILVGDRFTPLESQRTFPFIESAETIGGILGGILVGIFASQISVSIFLYLWMTFLTAVVLVLIITNYIRSVPPLPFATVQQHEAPLSSRNEAKKIFMGIKQLPFLKGLIVIVLLQWVFMNILEFQYTKAIQQRVTRDPEQTVAHLETTSFHAAVLHSSEGLPQTNKQEEVKRVLSPGEQQAFAAQLGTLKSIFSFAALIVQALLASRLITSLGIVGSLLLHPIIMLMSLVGMFLKFGFLSSVGSKIAFEVTNVVHKNAYFASHYALPRTIRDQAAEFLEGVVRPMGTIVGMLFILALQLLFTGKDLSMWIHSIMFTLMAIILVATVRLQHMYTAVTRTQLFSNLPYPDHLNAIEILAQKGHRQAPFILVQKLRETAKTISEGQSPVVRVKLLSALGQFRDYTTLPEILESLYDPDPEVRLEAAHALMNFYDIGEKFYTQAFSRYRMVETLKEIFRTEQSTAVRSAIIRLFSLLRQPDTVAFLLDILKNDHVETKAACIYTLGLFKDPNAAYYIGPFLNDSNPNIRANAISALWQFPQYRNLLEERLHEMLSNPDPSVKKGALFAIGESGLCSSYRRELVGFLEGTDSELSREAAFALTKCGDERGFSLLLNYFLDLPSQEFDSLRRLLKRLKPKARKIAEYSINHRISEELGLLMHQKKFVAIHEIPDASLQRLQRLYRLSEQHEELFAIEEALKKKMPALVT